MTAMGNGDGTGARSNARRDVEVTDGQGPWRSVGRVEKAQGHAIHSDGMNTTADAKETISTG